MAIGPALKLWRLPFPPSGSRSLVTASATVLVPLLSCDPRVWGMTLA